MDKGSSFVNVVEETTPSTSFDGCRCNMESAMSTVACAASSSSSVSIGSDTTGIPVKHVCKGGSCLLGEVRLDDEHGDKDDRMDNSLTSMLSPEGFDTFDCMENKEVVSCPLVGEIGTVVLMVSLVPKDGIV